MVHWWVLVHCARISSPLDIVVHKDCFHLAQQQIEQRPYL
jgi:hypothetical protein